jgi:hypothetical protein
MEPRGAPSLPQAVADLNNQELVAVFKDLQQLSNMLNAGSATQRHLSATNFQNRICSVQYRLLRLQGNLDNIIAESLRLAMLAFLATTFQVPGTNLRYPYLARCFRECCGAIEISAPHLRDLMLWLLTVGAISLFSAAEPWLSERWQAEIPPQMTWDEARQHLKNMLWINAIHDQPGQQAFKVLNLEEVLDASRDSSTDKLWASGWAGCTYK